jgi:hypothetical protein
MKLIYYLVYKNINTSLDSLISKNIRLNHINKKYFKKLFKELFYILNEVERAKRSGDNIIYVTGITVIAVNILYNHFNIKENYEESDGPTICLTWK